MRRIVDFAPVLAAVMRSSVERVVFVEGERVLEDAIEKYPRLVFAMNHGPAHLPIIPIAALGRAVIDHGGGARRCIGITFRGLYLVPGVRELASYLTQVEAPPSVDELLERAERDEYDDVVLMPEGHNSVFGDPGAIQPFASPRFVELAVRLGAPIVLGVHAGLENAASEVVAPRGILDSPWLARLPYGLGDSLQRAGSFALPTGVPGASQKRRELHVAFRLHVPSLDLAGLLALSPHARRDWVTAEAKRVRETMIAMHRTLVASMAHSGAGPTLAPPDSGEARAPSGSDPREASGDARRAELSDVRDRPDHEDAHARAPLPSPDERP